jgi:hypothetical protein
MLLTSLILILVVLLVLISVSAPASDPEMTLKAKQRDLSNQLHRLRSRK